MFYEKLTRVSFGKTGLRCALCIIGVVVASAFAGLNHLLSEKLQTALDSELTRQDVKGLSAAVSCPDGAVWSGASGISFDTVEVTPDMLFGIGSITKNFVAALLLQLIEEGTLTLDDHLSRWLPAYPNVSDTITVRQLLSHTSGLYNFTDNTELTDSTIAQPSRRWLPEEILHTFIKEPVFAPGADYSYSNTNYLLLGLIIETATGNSLVSELRNRLFTPLNLTTMYLYPDETYSDELAHLWLQLDSLSPLMDVSLISTVGLFSAAWAGGAIISTPTDLVSWYHQLYSGHVLSDSMLTLMMTPSPQSVLQQQPYGFGTMVAPLYQSHAYGHSGNIGYVSQLFYSPSDTIAIAVACNQLVDINTVWIRLYNVYKAFHIPAPVMHERSRRSRGFAGNCVSAVGMRRANFASLAQKPGASIELFRPDGKFIGVYSRTADRIDPVPADPGRQSHGVWILRIKK